MTLNDFTQLAAEQKAPLLVFSGELSSHSTNPELYFRLYYYKKFYFEEVVHRTSNTVLETNSVQKFAHFKNYLLAIRAEKLAH